MSGRTRATQNFVIMAVMCFNAGFICWPRGYVLLMFISGFGAGACAIMGIVYLIDHIKSERR